MIIKSNFAERRKHNRFKVKEGTLVEFHKPRLFNLVKPRVVKSASIVDISKEGLAFQYIDKNMWSPDFNELSIAETHDKIKIDKLPFKTVSDFSISRVTGTRFLRRCGVKFGELTPDQKTRLHYFILGHTISRHSKDRRIGQERRQLNESKSNDSEKRMGAERRQKLLLK